MPKPADVQIVKASRADWNGARAEALGMKKKEQCAAYQIACATAHGWVTAKKSLLELTELVLEHGLPSRIEREAMKEAMLANSRDTQPAEQHPKP